MTTKAEVKQSHTPTLENIIFSLPLWDRNSQDLETIAKELNIKNGFEPTQEKMAGKILDSIVKAVNNHYDLLKALKLMIHNPKENLDWAKEAIAKAEAK